MLTPLDIHNKEFRKGMRGYDVNEVDEFLDEVIKEFETLYKENLDLREQQENLKESLGRYKEMEDTLQSTMVLAQKMAEEAKRNAEKEAELITWEAKKRAEQIIAGADEQIIENTRRLENIKTYEKQLVIKLKTFLRTQLETLNDGLVLDQGLLQESHQQAEHNDSGN